MVTRLTTVAIAGLLVVTASEALAQHAGETPGNTGEPHNGTATPPVSEQTAPPAPAAEPDTPPPSAWDRKRTGEEAEPGPQPKEEINWGAQLAKTVVALLLVIALVYLVFKVGLTRILGYATARSGNALKVVERVQLDARHALFLVELSPGSRLLLGTGERGVQLITRLDETGRTIGGGSQTDFGEVLSKSSRASGDSDETS